MKNCILFLGLVLIFLGSCTQEEPIRGNYSIIGASEFIDNYNIGKFDYQQAEYIEGKVFIRTATDNRLVAFVTTPNKPTVVFQLQTQRLSDLGFQTSIENAQILFFRENLIINSIDKKEKYFFSLTSKESPFELKGEYSTYKGFGLSRYTFESDQLATNSRSKDTFGGPGDPPPAEGCTCVTTQHTNDCDSGGLGASACSGNYGPGGSPCSVTCDNDTGIHACCK